MSQFIDSSISLIRWLNAISPRAEAILQFCHISHKMCWVYPPFTLAQTVELICHTKRRLVNCLWHDLAACSDNSLLTLTMRIFIAYTLALRSPLHTTRVTNTFCMIRDSHSGGYEEFCLLGITPHSPLKVNRRFGGTFCVRFHGRRINGVRNQREIRMRHVPPKRPLTFNGLYGVISQRTELLVIRPFLLGANTHIRDKTACIHTLPEHRVFLLRWERVSVTVE
jgi:hypothetical protein